MREERKEILYTLNYREKGIKKSVEFKIDFVSLFIINSVEYVIEESNKVQSNVSKMQMKYLDMELLQEEKAEGYNDKIAKLREEIKVIVSEIMENNKSGKDLVGKQLDAIIQLLEDNGVIEEKFLTRKFWEKNVDVQEIIQLLYSVVNKDVDKKKIILNQEK